MKRGRNRTATAHRDAPPEDERPAELGSSGTTQQSFDCTYQRRVMVGFRYNPIFRQSPLISGGTTQDHQAGVVVAGFCVILGLDLLIGGRIGLQIEDDHMWMVLAGKFDALTSPRCFQRLDPTAFERRTQHLACVFGLIDNQNPAARGGR